MSDAGQTLTLEEVAGLLQIAPYQLAARRGALYKKGFPRPLPGLNNRWSARRIRAWVDGDDPAMVPTRDLAGHEEDDALRRQREVLESLD